MSSTDKILPEEIPTLKNRVLELQSKVDWYEEQFRLLQHKRFGTSSEKEAHPDFFNEAETFAEEAPEVRETITYERKKPVVSLYLKTYLVKLFVMSYLKQNKSVTAVITCMKLVKRPQSNWKLFLLRYML
ncbi:transposase [sulfur-oxidizing endosymbiont of Gigantopelta aegis]|uniref:transposase n=1 Tax=sulfur-oxidizing endosymbiont of Gigantopelta aegis TaxID=2794934 RepID=UPI0018DC9653|nr:transposase [sulfur-oxidizing endosymbiont of Gigantopelta aegis]